VDLTSTSSEHEGLAHRLLTTGRIYNLKQRKEVGTLLQHDGTITCFANAGKSHFISAAADGAICLWRTVSLCCALCVTDDA
jgi:WD40 repeat protein